MSVATKLLSHADYLADTSRISNSMLKDFRTSIPLYHGRYVTRTIPRKKSTKAQATGSVLHLSLHEPHWLEQVAIEPPLAPDGKKWYCRKGSQHEQWWNEWEASCVGKFLLDDQQLAAVKAMRDALFADPMAGPLLKSAGEWERTITWTDEDTGRPCKCRPDFMRHDLLIDVKTANDPSPDGFNRAVEEWSYAHQQEWYRAGYAAEFGTVPDFIFVVVGNELPYDVLVTRLDLDWQMIGCEENSRDLQRLADCYAFDQWRSAQCGTIHELSPPVWRLKKWENAA